MLQRKLSKIRTLVLSAAFLGGALNAAFGSGRGPAPSAAHATTPAAPTVHKPATPMILNPHLHIATPSGTTPAPHSAATAAPTAHPAGATSPAHATPGLLIPHQSWSSAWDSHSFIALHRGLAIIHGEVRNPSGQPVNDARVALRKPGGRIFANVALRHITFTSAGGEFTMTNVRPGTYRVFASQAKKKGFTRTVVHADTVEIITVKI